MRECLAMGISLDVGRSPDLGLRKPGFILAGSLRTTFVVLGNFVKFKR